MSRLQNAGLRLIPSKCHLLQTEVLFLGHIVGAEGVKTNPKLVQSVSNWKVPTDPRQVKQFLGLCNYYRRFVPDFGDIAHPLYLLTEKEARFEWTDECETAFNQLKVLLTNAPVFAYPRPDGKMFLDTDASNIGIGAVLFQEQDGQERVIAYASKRLDKRQRRFCVTRRELLLLAGVTFIQQFRHYLLGRTFDLRTDHNSLKWLFSFNEPQDQLAWWLVVLAQYQLWPNTLWLLPSQVRTLPCGELQTLPKTVWNMEWISYGDWWCHPAITDKTSCKTRKREQCNSN